MRIIFILFFLGFSVSSSFGQSLLKKQVSFAINDVSISEGIQALIQASNIDIAYSNNFFKKRKKITRHFKNEPFEKALSSILKNTNVGFKVLDDRVLLFLKKEAQLFTLSGYVKDKKSGEHLIAATIYDSKNHKGTITNEYGFYSLTLPEGETNLHIQFLGYQENFRLVDLDKNLRYDIPLETNLTLPEIIVYPENQETSSIHRAANNVIQINKNFVEGSNGLGGEEDFVRTSQLLPGVQGGIDGLGGIQVRGGESGHNLTLMDGVPVFIPYHLLGVLSVYNSSTVNSAQLLKGSFSARYGGRLSSVYDIRIKEGNKKKWKGEVGLNLINGNILLEGPIQKGKGSILIAGRYAPNGFLLNPEFKRIYFRIGGEEGELTSSFGDFNIKMNYSITPKDHLYLSVFSGTDVFYRSVSEEDEEEKTSRDSQLDFGWNNKIGVLRWNHLFNEKLFLNTTITYSEFSFDNVSFEEYEEDDDTSDLEFLENQSYNRDVGVKLDFDYLPNPKHTIRFGAALSDKEFITSFVFFDEEDEELIDIEDIDLMTIQELTTGQVFTATEASVYVEDQINIGTNWYASIGLRGSSFFNESKKYFNFEPRLTLRYYCSPKLSVFSSASRMVQYLHLVTNTALRLPNDLWIPSGKDVLPSTALQGEIGLSWQASNKLSLNVDAYYKKMENLLAYPDDRDFLEDIDLETPSTFLTSGEGRTYGVEVFFKYSSKKNEAGLSYVLSKSERKYKDQNLGLYYPHEYDQRHQIKFFFYRKLGKRFGLGGSWVYNSPNPQWGLANTNLSEEEEENVAFNPLGQKNRLRSIPYQKIDLNVSFQHQGAKLTHRFKLGVYNISNRQNAVFYNRYSDGLNDVSESVDGLPFLPSFSYHMKF